MAVPENAAGDFALPQHIDIEQEIANDIADCEHDPLAFAKYAFEWGDGELSDSTGPREWQSTILDYIGGHLKNPKTRHQPCRIAVASGHGIGKSALIGMIIGWAQSTCEDAKIIVTANTGTQLDTKTVPEVATWFRRAINAHWFEVNAKTIKVKDSAHEKTWRTDFIPWSEENPQAFAGMHNKGKRIVLIFDEASEISKIIWETASGALTDENTEIIWLAFGNPTKNDGNFRECFGSASHRWKTFQIDSRNVEGTNKQEISGWIEDHGEDSDYVRIRVRGEFPRAGFNQFIPSDVVAAARKYKAEGFESLPKIGSCDVARFGDDQTVIGDRQGRRARIWRKFRGLDIMQTAARCMEYIDEEEPDAFLVDADGLGAGVFDALKHHNYDRKTKLFEFHGGSVPDDVNAYFNKRAEVWGYTRNWLKAGAEIPNDPELSEDLTVPKYGMSNKQQIVLEKKDDMKKRGFRSPDCGDMLAMTFAEKIIAKPKQKPQVRGWNSGRASELGWMAN